MKIETETGGEAAERASRAETGVEVLRRSPRDDPPRPSGVGDLVGMLKGIPGFARLLYRLMKDPRVSKLDRALFAFTLGYLFTPVDVIPDWIPVLGSLDDVVLLVVTLDRLLHRTDRAVLEDHWDGRVERLWQILGTLDWATDMIPGWARRFLRGA